MGATGTGGDGGIVRDECVSISLGGGTRIFPQIALAIGVLTSLVFFFFHFFFLVLWSLRALDRAWTGFMVQGRWSESFLVPESTRQIFAKSGKASAFRPLQANVVARRRESVEMKRDGHTRRTSRSQKTWKGGQKPPESMFVTPRVWSAGSVSAAVKSWWHWDWE